MENLLQSVHCLSLPHIEMSVGFVSLCPLQNSSVCQLSVSTSGCTVCLLCNTVSTSVFYSLSTVCQYLILYRLLVLCHCVHSRSLESVLCLSVHHTVPYLGSVSLCSPLPSTVCPLSDSTSHSTVGWFCVMVSTAIFYSLSTVCQYLTLYHLFVLHLYVHDCLLLSLHSLSLSHTLPSFGAVSLCPLLSSTVCALSDSTTRCK
jgi:hypothetical protein